MIGIDAQIKSLWWMSKKQFSGFETGFGVRERFAVESGYFT
jgi:hypothetical protein